MPKISFLKLLFVLVAVLTVAGVGYGSLVVWRERASIDTKELVSGEKPAREGQPTIEPLSPLSPTEPSVTDIDIFDWKTYVNEYGYELQYPSNWFPSSSSEGSYFVVSAARPEEFVYGTLPEGDAAVTVTVAYRSKTIPFNEWISQALNPYPVKTRLKISSSPIKVDGVQGQDITYVTTEQKFHEEGRVVYLPKHSNALGKDVVFGINLYYYRGDKRTRYYHDTFNQILSTLRFIEDDLSSGD